ncbi:MAG: Uncharacterised protein [Cyanobium sp. ARS6]|nr:MAG: Uncharacterised protein [Cyanobium sp. ARS6]|tara:strand:+ start:35 stop:514 length:480 start_codon:yes stop_codon:yes gene_type:complete
MAAAEAQSVMVQQLSRQLHAVSEIAESLTLRLLALEERFEELNQTASSQRSVSGPDEASQQLLDESGDRLKHLQGLLDEDGRGQVIELVPQLDEEMVPASMDVVISHEEGLEAMEEEVEPSLNETVYVDDPQIDPAHEEINGQDIEEEDGDDQIDLLSA